jgi:hypothetical protein
MPTEKKKLKVHFVYLQVIRGEQRDVGQLRQGPSSRSPLALWSQFQQPIFANDSSKKSDYKARCDMPFQLFAACDFNF